VIKKARPRRRLRTQGKKSKQAFLAEVASFRSLLIVLLVLSGFMFTGVNLVWLSLVPVDEPVNKFARSNQVMPSRGAIYDRHGVLLATTLKVRSLYADPKMMLDVNESLMKLAIAVPSLNFERLAPRLQNKKRRFVWLKRKLTPTQVKAVNDLGVPGVFFREEFARIYPHKNLASHVLGTVDVDGKGMSGVEGSYDEQLAQGEDVHLTLDIRLQGQLRSTLLKNIDRTEAKSSWGIVTNPMNGEILALSSLPDYDPNHYGTAEKASWLNKAVYGSYEMGSTFKIFTMAQGVDQGYVNEETPLDIRKPLRVGKYTINDSHPRYKIMTMKEVFRRSSNIGAARVADMFEKGSQEAFFGELNLLSSVDIGLKEIGHPRYTNRWGRIQTMTRAYGHGLAVTPVQMIGAVGAVVSDGTYKMPHIVKGFEMEEPRKVIEPETVAVVRDLMTDVVENGTGRRARLDGYSIGGKTGTAEKAEYGRYSRDKNVASFVGMIPVDNPQLLALVMVDEPSAPDNGGGSAAAPAFRNFISRAAPMVGIRPELNPMNINSFELKRMAANETLRVTR
jgi:cell division protein FtsI (penicillin-binding protein 3)